MLASPSFTICAWSISSISFISFWSFSCCFCSLSSRGLVFLLVIFPDLDNLSILSAAVSLVANSCFFLSAASFFSLLEPHNWFFRKQIIGALYAILLQRGIASRRPVFKIADFLFFSFENKSSSLFDFICEMCVSYLRWLYF